MQYLRGKYRIYKVILVFAALGVIKYGLGANHMPPPPQVCVFIIEDLREESCKIFTQTSSPDERYDGDFFSILNPAAAVHFKEWPLKAATISTPRKQSTPYPPLPHQEIWRV